MTGKPGMLSVQTEGLLKLFALFNTSVHVGLCSMQSMEIY